MNGSRERDRSVERLLRQSRQASQGPEGPKDVGVTDSCLDAETLAAWADGGLSGGALDLARAHVADCARCQMLMGALARTDTIVPDAEPARASRWWLNWLVPVTAAAAAATAFALWVAVPRDASSRLRQEMEQARQNVEQANASTTQERDARPQAPASAAPVGGATTTEATAASGKAEQTAQAGGNVRQLQPAMTDAAGGNLPAREFAKDAAKADSDQLGASPPEPRRDVGRLEAESTKPPSAAPAPASAVAAAAPRPLAERAASSAQSAGRGGNSAIEIGSPDPAVRWRIAGSAVQRSTNGGSTWQDVPTGVVGSLTAGAAPSASVCWVVGRGGLVLVSTDGVRWRRVPFPEPTDLSGVRAASATAATVSAADGRTFSTTDGGGIWVLR